MGWKLPPAAHETFPRNPLTTVVAQLRFHPILKIDRERPEVVDFQDVVRSRFPVYQEVEARDFRLDPIARTFLERVGVQFRFATEDQSSLIALSKDALAVEAGSYHNHQAFLDGVRLAVEALAKVFQPVKLQRLGLRYVNQISREAVSADLGWSCDWKDLVTQDLLRAPEQLDSLDDAAFASEITAPINDGLITLRYGIRRPLEEPCFVLDIDRYQSNDLVLDGILSKLEGFSEECSSLFEGYRGEALIQWMKAEEVD